MTKYAALIVGAGPAGTATALALTHLGVGPIAVTGLPGLSPALGETLPGAARALLRDLGVWPAFEADRHAPILGAVSQWGSDQIEIRDAFANPQGPGWRLDRDRFEHMMLNQAKRGGVTVLHGRAVSFQRERGGWRIRLTPGGDVCCQTVVDAAGRRAPIARRLGVSKARLDRLTAHIALDPDAARTRWDGFSQITARETGWSYSTHLPDGNRLDALFTDSDLGPAPALPIVKCAAWSGRLTSFAGPGWAAVGDAACCFDPLSSQGIFHALYGGLRLGNALAGGGLDTYAAEIEAVWAAYRQHYHAYYAEERRWPDAPFWKRRSSGWQTEYRRIP